MLTSFDAFIRKNTGLIDTRIKNLPFITTKVVWCRLTFWQCFLSYIWLISAVAQLEHGPAPGAQSESRVVDTDQINICHVKGSSSPGWMLHVLLFVALQAESCRSKRGGSFSFASVWGTSPAHNSFSALWLKLKVCMTSAFWPLCKIKTFYFLIFLRAFLPLSWWPDALHH